MVAVREGDMQEFVEVMQAALQAVARGETVALATVVRVRGSAPRHEGARLVVWPDGRLCGTVGGATLEQKVIEHAQEALGEGRSRLETYRLTTDQDPVSLGLCGGAVEVHIEILQAEATLVLIGAGHIARPLAQMGKAIGMRVCVVDDRSDFAQENHFPEADRLYVVAYDAAEERLEPMPVEFDANSYVVVATWGWDEPALAQVLASDPLPPYVGLVASKTKARVLKERLESRGMAPSRTALVRAPAGLDLGAETPGEIALSILAEILLVRRQATGRPMMPPPSKADRTPEAG